MKHALELIKQAFFVFFEILWEIIKNIWKPIYTTVVKTLIICGLLMCIAKFMPHNLPYIKDVPFLGWVSIVFMYRLITFKYDDFDDEDDETEETEIPNYLVDDKEDMELPPSDPIPPQPPNILKKKNDPNSSTRE